MANQEKLVTVSLDSNNILTIDLPEVQVDAGDWVQWTFEGLQEDEFGFISFAPPLPRFGPFHSLRSLRPGSVLGKGNKGGTVGDTYGYRALVLNLSQPAAVASSVGMIINNAYKENTAPDIQVSYCTGDDGLPQLVVSPDPVGLNTGDTATWRFSNLPENAFACFKFEAVTAGMPQQLGPFIAFSACNGEEEDEEGVIVEASGTGFAVGGTGIQTVESFTYYIEIRDWSGQRLASHEPVIDNLGPPIG